MSHRINDIVTAAMGMVLAAAIVGGWSWVRQTSEDRATTKQQGEAIAQLKIDMQQDRSRTWAMFGWSHGRIDDLYNAGGKPLPPEPMLK